MTDLPGITLVAIDTANHALALRALARSREQLRFARTLFLTEGLPADVRVPPGVEVAAIDPIESRDAYSRFVLKALLHFVATPHLLLVQWDGYVVNPAAWDDAFLDCDYIGAQWFWRPAGRRVGNGGFSLRSRRLLEALADPRIVPVDNEDVTICDAFRPLLEREHGIRFASEALADRFAFEAAYPVGRPFGFHGLFNFARVVPEDELAALAPAFPDAIAGSPQFAALMRNCAALAQWKALAALARRRLSVSPTDAPAAELLRQAEAGAAAAAPAGRNDPCPCGSGKRYKHCHGTLGAATAAPTPDELARRALDAHRRGDLDAAERGYTAALAGAHDHPLALHYLGVIAYQRGRAADALPLLERAAAQVPDEPEFHNNLGLALAALDRLDDAIAAHRRTLALAPAHADAWSNLGLALTAADRLPDAIDAYRQALAHAPDHGEAHWNLALALLAAGRFAEGWREYEWRLKLPRLAGGAGTPPGPRWRGEDPRGRTLLLVAEQGLGDTLQFVRFARTLRDRGARVIVQAPAALAGLLATVDGVAAVYAPDATLPPYDAHVPLLSLPGLLGVDRASIPGHVPYLHADPARLADVSAALKRTAGDALAIGLAWAGSRSHPNDRRRSCRLAVLAPLLDVPGTAWFSLQKGEAAAEIGELRTASNLERLPDDNHFDDTAARVAALDLVITVDTSVAHLSGALARPTWLLLPFAADWRWERGRSDSPWYPTARLFRQPRPGDWPAVVAEVAAALRELVARR